MLKAILKKILQYYLKFITKLVLFLHKPIIIAIAGSTNKTFFKDSINTELREAGLEVRSNPRSFNTEIGLPLAILNLSSGYNSYAAWLPVMKDAFLAIFKKDFPEYLILELGVSDAGDMRYLLSIIKPRIAVITDITQRYLEGFDNMDELATEYEYLVRSMDKRGVVLLNSDNPMVKKMAESTNAEVIFFGINEGADWQAKMINSFNISQNITIYNKLGTMDCEIRRKGDHHILACLAGKIIKDRLKDEQYVALEKK